jgi:L-threonylcarbamoyladenylate synthase
MQEDLKKSLDVLRKGGLILYPTDTIWGIGCDATNESAVQKIFLIKKREDFKSMLILVDSPGKLERYVIVPDIAWELIEVGTSPLTIIYPGARNLAPGLIAVDGSAGIRITSDEFCLELIKRFGKPIVSTSANLSGTPSPAIFDEIRDEIISSVDYVVSWRQDDIQKRPASAIIKLEENGSFKIIRK